MVNGGGAGEGEERSTEGDLSFRFAEADAVAAGQRTEESDVVEVDVDGSRKSRCRRANVLN